MNAFAVHFCIFAVCTLDPIETASKQAAKQYVSSFFCKFFAKTDEIRTLQFFSKCQVKLHWYLKAPWEKGQNPKYVRVT